MVNALIVFVIVAVPCIIITLIFWLRLGRKYDAIYIPPDAPKVINNLQKYANGSGSGYELQCTLLNNGRYLVTYIGDDLEYDFEEETYPTPQVHEFIVDKNCRIIKAKGDRLKGRPCVEYLDPNETGYAHFKGTPLEAKYIESATALRTLNNIIMAFNAGKKAQVYSLKEGGGGDVSRTLLEQHDGLIQDAFSKIQQIQQVAEKAKGGKKS